jgi:hypothetical protein
LGERRAFRPGGGAAGTGARRADGAKGVDGLGDAEDDEYYGQLLRRPGDRPPYQSRLRQPGGPRMQQPGRFAPPGGQPGSGYRPNGDPAGGYPGEGDPAGGYQTNGDPAGGHPGNGDPAGGYPVSGYPGNGAAADGYRSKGEPLSGYPANGDYPGGDPGRGYPRSGYPPSGDPVGGYSGSGNQGGGYPRNGYPPGGNPGGGYPASGNQAGGYGPGGSAPGGSAPGGSAADGGPAGRRQYRLPNGRRVPPGADRLYHPGTAGSAGPAGGTRSRPGPGQGQDPQGGTWNRPGRPSPAPGAPSGAGGGYGGARTDGGSGWEHLRVPPAGRGVPISAEPPGPGAAGPAGLAGPGLAGPGLAGPGAAGPGAAGPGAAGPAGPVIRQRESALPGERPTGAAQPVASIAPDGLDSFARDLRALRAKAELDYPEMAETSHYTMKTLASAAGGLRLPTLPVAVAYVRACGGNVAEWEDRWQKLAAKITSDAKKRRADGDDQQGPPEPADTPAIAEPPALPAVKDPDPAPGEVYVITSAKPRQQDW